VAKEKARPLAVWADLYFILKRFMTALKSGHSLLLTIPLPLYRLREEIQETILGLVSFSQVGHHGPDLTTRPYRRKSHRPFWMICVAQEIFA
jgi:hypothetical protein